jgi:hypothetical protein
MGSLLIQNPLIHLHLVYVGALSLVFICAYLRNPPATIDDSRTQPNQLARPCS